MRFHSRARRPPVINIISMVDILCILVIFFIVTTVFKKNEPAVKIDLPQSKQAQAITSDPLPIIVYVTDNDLVYVNDKATAVAELSATLKTQLAEKKESKVALKASKQASFGLIIQVMDAAKAAGVRQLPAYTAEPTP